MSEGIINIRPMTAAEVRSAESKKMVPANYDSRTTTTKNTSRVHNLYTQEFSYLVSDNLKYYFECARLGLNFWKSLLFEEIRKRDLHIGGILQSRKRAIMSKLRNKKLTQLIQSDWEEGKQFIIDNLSQSSVKFTNFLSDIIEAEIQGVSIFEKVYHYKNGKLMLKEIPLISNHLVLYDDIENRYKFLDSSANDAMIMKSIGWLGMVDRIDFSQINTIDIHPDKLLEVHSLDGNSQNGFLNGFTDSLIWAYFFKSFSVKDWSVFLELYAMPARIGKYDSLMSNRADLDQFTKAVENFGSMYWAVINKDNEIELKDSNKSATSQVYDTFINYWDTKSSIRVLGNNITTEIQKHGSNSAVVGAKVVSDEIADSDILLVEDTVNTLIETLINLNFANPPEMPKFEFPLEKSLADLLTKSEIYVNLSGIGFKPTKEEISEEFDIDLDETTGQPVEDDATLIKLSEFIKKKSNVSEKTIHEYLEELWKTTNNS